MTKISEIKVNEQRESLEWKCTCQTQKIFIKLTGISQAMPHPKTNEVFALSGTEGQPGLLSIFSCSGEELGVILPPEGFQFYYLSDHPEVVISVVCVSSMPVEGWRDWHFGIDVQNSRLYRHCPAY